MLRRNWEILPHTADTRLKVTGKNSPALFQAALLGMNEILKKGACQKTNRLPIQEKISLTSADPTQLLIDFLSEVLARTQINKAIFCQAEFKKLGEKELEATISAATTESFDEDIKGVTYHEAQIKKNEKGELETIVIFDI